VEADDVTLLQRWVIEWADLVGFGIVPVAAAETESSSAAAAKLPVRAAASKA
jgi:hypothetical protein